MRNIYHRAGFYWLYSRIRDTSAQEKVRDLLLRKVESVEFFWDLYFGWGTGTNEKHL